MKLTYYTHPAALADYRELLLGCGYDRTKKINPHIFIDDEQQSKYLDWHNLVTLDRSARCIPDICMDLNRNPLFAWTAPEIVAEHPEWWELSHAPTDRFRLRSNYWDEIHAYEVLEHLGQQGDDQRFFSDFSQIWRMLKPGGFLVATVPSRFSPWLWGDPGHRRAILPETLPFLCQPHYQEACGDTPSSDYRDLYVADFDILMSRDNRTIFSFVLQAVKPSRHPGLQQP